MKKQNKKEVTKETIIIVGLICFIAGYAVNGLISSIGSFANPQSSSGTGIVQPRETGSPAQSKVDILKERVKANPEDTVSWINLGNSYFDTDRYDDAIAAYLKALELEPENPDVLSDLGVMYRRAGKPEKAISAFDKAYTADPTHPMSLFNKGIVLFYDLDRKNEAMEVWKMLISIDPEFRMPTGELMADFLGTVK